MNAPARRIGKRAGLVSAAALLTGATVIAVAGTSTAAPSEAERRGKWGKPTEAEIAALFDEWNAVLQSGDPEALAELYAPGALLQPTKSARIRTTHDGIVDYFVHFMERDPVGEKVYTEVTVLDHDTAMDAGTYVFTLTDEETGEVKQVGARYTYVYEKIDGEWLIINHHSSETPVED